MNSVSSSVIAKREVPPQTITSRQMCTLEYSMLGWHSSLTLAVIFMNEGPIAKNLDFQGHSDSWYIVSSVEAGK